MAKVQYQLFSNFFTTTDKTFIFEARPGTMLS